VVVGEPKFAVTSPQDHSPLQLPPAAIMIYKQPRNVGDGVVPAAGERTSVHEAIQ
jgi:hypothetical protein